MWRQVARIYIGGATEPEIEDKRLRYEDAINALKGGIAEGMVPGGGACYAYMLRYADEARALFREGSEEVVAVDVLCEAMSTPCKQIASKYAAGAREPGRARASPALAHGPLVWALCVHSAGVLGEMTLEKVKDREWGWGFNAKTLEYENLLEAGVCDPASVNTWALENSASIAGSLLTTEALICEKVRPPDEQEYRPEITAGIGEDAAKYAW